MFVHLQQSMITDSGIRERDFQNTVTLGRFMSWTGDFVEYIDH
jgi:hypothetical protein